MEGIPAEVERIRNHSSIRQLEKEDPDHTKCNGEPLQDIKTNIQGKKVQRCSKCHRWIEVKEVKQ